MVKYLGRVCYLSPWLNGLLQRQVHNEVCYLLSFWGSTSIWLCIYFDPQLPSFLCRLGLRNSNIQMNCDFLLWKAHWLMCCSFPSSQKNRHFYDALNGCFRRVKGNRNPYSILERATIVKFEEEKKIECLSRLLTNHYRSAALINRSLVHHHSAALP